jgi:tyrosyl-tRNA synthetase
VHGEEEYHKAIATTEKLFAQASAPAASLSEADLEGINGIVKLDYPKEALAAGVDIVSLLADTAICPSKGEARKMVLNGGISVNRHKIEAIAAVITTGQLLHDKYLLIQRGKKNYYLITVA